jgi:plasmid stability protein
LNALPERRIFTFEGDRDALGNLMIPNLDEALQASLREQAKRHGRSPADEARAILEGALPVARPVEANQSLGDEIHAFFAPFGGVDLPPPSRPTDRRIPFEDWEDDD